MPSRRDPSPGPAASADTPASPKQRQASAKPARSSSRSTPPLESAGAAPAPRPTTRTRRRPPGAGAAPGGESIAAVDRALDVLMLLGASGRADIGVTEISAELSLSKAAAHRILTSLRSRDLVVLDPRSRRYHLGPASLALGRAYLSRIDLRALAAAELAWLATQCDETAALSVRAGPGRMYVDQAVPDREARTEVALGRPLPLRTGAPGAAFLAFLPTEEMEALLRAEAAAGIGDGPSSGELTHVRRQGYAVGRGDGGGGIATLAAPVLDDEGLPAAVLSLCGPASRLVEQAETLAPLLLEASHRLSVRIGGPAAQPPSTAVRS